MSDIEEYMKNLRREQTEIINRMIEEKNKHKEGDDTVLTRFNFKDLMSVTDRYNIQRTKILEEKREAKKRMHKELAQEAHKHGNKMRWEK